jgi:hypothetical protein
MACFGGKRFCDSLWGRGILVSVAYFEKGEKGARERRVGQGQLDLSSDALPVSFSSKYSV